MSRWDAVSDLDYYDEPWDRPEPCATTGCDNACDIPASSAWCKDCRDREQLRRASENEKHRMESAREAKRRVKAGAA